MAIRNYDPQIYLNYLGIMERIGRVKLDDDTFDLEEKRGVLRDMGVKVVSVGGASYSLCKCNGVHLRTGIEREKRKLERYLETYEGKFEDDRAEGILQCLFGQQNGIEDVDDIITNPNLLNGRGIPKNMIRGIFTKRGY